MNLHEPDATTRPLDYWECHTEKDEQTGKSFWLPQCYGGAINGKSGCHCDPEENALRALENSFGGWT
jgi:hypothetical protein